MLIRKLPDAASRDPYGAASAPPDRRRAAWTRVIEWNGGAAQGPTLVGGAPSTIALSQSINFSPPALPVYSVSPLVSHPC